jgi:hypothetical protein
MTTDVSLTDRPLADLESIIEHGQQTFVEVGQALMAIRDRRLYREQGHATFEDYCQKRWGWSRDSGYKYIEAAQVAQNVESILQSPPSYTQAVQLAPLPIAQQQEIAQRVDFSQTTVSDLKVDRNARERAYRKKHPEEVRSRQRKYRKEHPEKVHQYQQKYQSTHKGQERERQHLYNQVHRQEINARLNAYRKKHADKVRLWNGNYRATQRGKAVLTAAQRNRDIRLSGIPLTADIIMEVKAEYAGLCPYCNRRINKGHIDHILPVSKGGTNERSNIAWVCQKCNQQKHDKTLLEFLMRANPSDGTI